MKSAKFIKQGTVVRELNFAALHELWLDGQDLHRMSVERVEKR